MNLGGGGYQFTPSNITSGTPQLSSRLAALALSARGEVCHGLFPTIGRGKSAN